MYSAEKKKSLILLCILAPKRKGSIKFLLVAYLFGEILMYVNVYIINYITFASKTIYKNESYAY